MAATAVSTVLSKFGELALSEGRLLVQVGEKMMLMRDRLEWLQAFIRDADRKRRTGTDGLSRVWLRQTRDVAFQVEDALDEFFRQVDLEGQGYEGWRLWGKYLAGCWTQITVRHVLSGRLDEINGRLEQISKNQKEFMIEHTPLVTSASSTTATAAWRDERDDTVGFDDDIKRLEEMLLRKDHPETLCISIIGESGVGKRTLADALYKKIPGTEAGQRILKLTAFVEPDSWPEQIVHTLYNGLSEEIKNSKKKEEMESSSQKKEEMKNCTGEDTDPASKLRAYFSSKKFILFVVGITSRAMFNLLRLCLPADSKNGSSVVLLLDAEHEEVGLHASSMNRGSDMKMKGIHLVSRLDKKTSGELFRCKALRKGEVLAEGDEDKYDEMVFAITGGHRLSIVLLAGLVRFKEKPLQWEAVLQQLLVPAAGATTQKQDEQEAAMVGSDEQLRRNNNLVLRRNNNLVSCCTAVERIFWASFEDLPSDVKSCFLYFAIATKNAAVGAGFVFKWIAEGFIRPHKGKTMDEVGKRYLKELVLRGLVQVYKLDDLGAIAKVRVHSSLHGFLQSEAREAGFAEVHDIHDAYFVPPSARRISFHIHGGRYIALNGKLPKLRTFICFGGGKADKGSVDSTGAALEAYDMRFLLASKFLRVLEVDGLRVPELPKDIGKLLELRYVRITSPELKVLPSTINRLLKLQMLDVTGTGVESVDPGFWKIKTLRHVFASGITLPDSLDLEEQDLGELQTLSGVKPAQDKTLDPNKCPLRRMIKLRKLEIEGIQHVYHRSALESALQEMHLLVDVSLKGDLLPSCVLTAKNLRFLEKIQLNGLVDWPAGELNHHMLRPNLRQINLEPITEVPQRILEELHRKR